MGLQREPRFGDVLRVTKAITGPTSPLTDTRRWMVIASGAAANGGVKTVLVSETWLDRSVLVNWPIRGLMEGNWEIVSE